MQSELNQNLLFGILALQMHFISREQLVATTREWLRDKSRGIEEMLLQQNAFSEQDRQLLTPLVARHLENHEGDADKSLAALSSVGSLQEDLRALGDRQLDATLSVVGRGREDQQVAETMNSSLGGARTLSVSSATSAGSRFRILRPHAKGGLGEVSLAEDTELSREVALKEIQPQFADDHDSRSRFMLEAEVTGGLEHPGIVPVYGLGQYADGRPYYAMRFIRGDSLKEAVDRFHKESLSSDSERTLQLRKLLGRFVDVCNAISFAHSRGVLHRDLKPGNIMLGKYGETLVVDWGLAKLTGRDDDTRTEGEAALAPGTGSGNAPTQIGSAIGTPAFMPPEQAAGRLDELGPESDVYSLGATLYYLLTGRQPFGGNNLGEVLRRVQTGEFASPRTIDHRVPKTLEAICLRAMATRSKDRYASPQELADEVERFLADEPVDAYPEPFLVSARRWVRKHQTLAATTAAVVLVSAVGLGAFSTIVSGKNRELTKLNTSLDQKNSELADKNTALVEANQRETKARELAQANEETAKQQSQLALATLTSVIQDLQVALADLSGGAGVRRRLLATSLAKLEDVASAYVAQARVDRNTMVALGEMGNVILDFGVGGVHESDLVVNQVQATPEEKSALELAHVFYSRALEISTKLVAADPSDADAQHDLCISYLSLGEAEYRAGRLREAMTQFQKSMEIATDLFANAPDDEAARRALLSTYENIGDAQRRAGQLDDALATYQKHLEISSKWESDDPTRSLAQRELSDSLLKIGVVQRQARRLSEAVSALERSVEIRQRLVEADPNNARAQRDLAYAQSSLGDAQRQAGQFDEALLSYTKDLEICEKLALADPNSGVSQRLLSRAYVRMGDMQHQSGQIPALGWYQKLLEHCTKLAQEDPGDTRLQRSLYVAYERVGRMQLGARQMSGALRAFQKCLEISQNLAVVDPSDVRAKRDVLFSHARLGDLYRVSQQLDKALESYQQCLIISQELAAIEPNNAEMQRDISMAYRSLGDVHLQSDRPGDALDCYENSAEVGEKLAALDPQDVQSQRDLSISYEHVGNAQLRLGRLPEALASYQKVLPIREKLAAAAAPNDAEARRDLMVINHNLGKTFRAQADYEAAAAAFRAGAEILRAMIDKGMHVEQSKRELAFLEDEARRAELAKTALGDWDELLKQPKESLPALLEVRCVTLVGLSRISEAAQSAIQLRQQESASADQLYNAACVLSLCAASIKAAEGQDLTADGTKQRQTWIDEALAALKQSIAAGYDNFAHMQKDPDLAILRDLPAYQMLLPKSDAPQPKNPDE